MGPRNNAVRQGASPVECSGAFCHGLLAPEALVRRAETRWADIAAAQPDLIPAIAVQRPMVIRTIRLVDRLRHEPPALRLTPQRIADKLAAGDPMMRGEAAALPVLLLAPLVLEACDDLAAGGAGDVARRVRGCIDDGRVDMGSLLAASFDRNQRAIRAKAMHEGIAPDVLWLAAELAAGPAAHVAARTLLGGEAAEPGIAAARDRWPHGYCPACGSWPAFAEACGGAGRLRCSFCGLDWPARADRCPYCRDEDSSPTWATMSPGARDRAALCTRCGGYLKWLEPATATPFELLAVEDLASCAVDALAAGRGFGRPPLPTLAGPDRLPCEGLEPDREPPAAGDEPGDADAPGGTAPERGGP